MRQHAELHLLWRLGVVAIFSLWVTTPAIAQALDEPKTINVPSQSLGDALRLLAKQASLQVLFAPDLVEGRTAPSVVGTLSARAALEQLLAGTRLSVIEQSPGVIVLHARPTGTNAPVRPPNPPPPVTPPAASEQSELQEIVVTAQRREERLQDVPISVSVYNQTAMDAQGVRVIDDISRITPGVTFVRGANNNNSESSDIAIRGIVSNAGAATTGVYIDDTPIQGRHLSFPSYNTYPELFDLERVEVLRGPQGTLFGAGSEGGTVRFISPEPSLDRYVSYDRSEVAVTSNGDPVYELGAAGGGPISPGRLGFRASASYRHEGGYVDRVDWHTGSIVDPDANANSTVTARMALKWAVTDDLSITPSVYFQKRQVDDTAAWWSPRSDQPDPTDGQFARPFRNGNAASQPSTDKFVLPALRIEWRFGDLQLVSNTSYFKRDQSATTDYTQFDRAIFLGDPYPPTGARGLGFWGDHQANWTQEVRLQSTDPAARVTWTTGVFYQHARETTSHRVFDPTLLTDLGLPPDFGDGFIYVEDPRVGIDRQIAVFGQTDIRLLERLKLTAGLRYASASFEGTAFYPETLVVGPEVFSSGTQKEHPVTPKFGLSYQLGRDNLLYATAAKGFRIGGTNPKVGQFCYGGSDSALGQIGLTDVPPAYNSDSVWSYEIGTKNAFADNHVVVNASAYLIKWKNIQQNVPLTACGFQYTGNIGEAESKGFDLQTQVSVSRALSLGVSFSYTDARFTETVQLQPTVQSIVRAGDHLAGSPWTAVLFAQSNLPLGQNTAYARADYQYSAQQTDLAPNQNPLNGGYAPWFPSVPAQSYASVRAGFKRGGLDLSLFAQNLLDTRPRLTATQDIGIPTGGTPLFYVITWRPRTIGLTATFSY
ncbi:MAG: TonB-dependent receptor [Gammaproteobacteria bacterium]|nr:TonB-dependent receptor [Gammaproteobacteria bacterium]